MSGGVGRGRQWWSCRPKSTGTTRTRRVTRTMSVPKEPEGYHVSKRTVRDCAGVLMSWDHWEEHLIVHVDTARVRSQVPVHTHTHSRPPTVIKTPDKQTIQKVQNNTKKKCCVLVSHLLVFKYVIRGSRNRPFGFTFLSPTDHMWQQLTSCHTLKVLWTSSVVGFIGAFFGKRLKSVLF